MLAALVLAAWFCHCFDWQRPQLFRSWREGPGLGFCLFMLGGMGVSLLLLGRRARYTRANIALLAAFAALSLTFVLTADPLLRRLNMAVLLPVTVSLLLSLAGLFATSPWSLDSVGPALRRFLPAPFRYWLRPLAAVGGLTAGSRGPWRSVLIGLAVALPLLALALSLLSSADAVFANIFVDLRDWLRQLEVRRALWVCLRALTLGLAGFSILYTLVRPPRPLRAAPAARARLPLLSWTLVLALLDAVYLLFVAIQFAFLFGGAETAAMQGGYAQYAREGFAQLVLVSMINLLVIFLAQRAHPGRRGLQICGSLLLACTAVILVSAAWRMHLYILEYGLSVLRLLTYWGIAMIALALAAALLKLWRPGLQVSAALLAVVVAAWIAFNFSGVDMAVAGYNVSAYLEGQTQRIDVDYLSQLSPAVIPSLQRLADAGHAPAQAVLIDFAAYREEVAWLDWSLPWTRAAKL